MLREEIYRQTITIFQSLKIQKGNDDVVAWPSPTRCKVQPLRDKLKPQTWAETHLEKPYKRNEAPPFTRTTASSHDIPPASSHHRRTNHRFTGTHQSSLAPHHLHRKRLQLMCFHYRKASIASSRSHPSLFITNTEKKSSHETSPFTTGELRSSSTRSHPSNPARNRINKDTKPNPKTELGNQKPATQGKERLHPPESKAGDTRQGTTSPAGVKSRRRATIDVGSLPELTTTNGDWTRAQTRRSGKGNEREAGDVDLNGRTKDSGDGKFAHAPADLSWEPICRPRCRRD
ncbi:hypothetical protein YC2023_102217 [Brassica napus]